MMTNGSTTSWKEHKLGELGQYINGRAFKPAEWKNEGLPIIRIQNLTDPDKPYNYFDGEVSEKHLVRDGDLLISWSATLGSFIWDRGDAALNQHIFKVEVNESVVEKEFLHYLILHILDDLASQTHGSTMKHITKRKFEATPVMLPPLEKQRRLVARIRECLDRVDAIRMLREESIAGADLVEAAVFDDFLLEHGYSDDARVPLGSVLLETQYGTSQKASATGEGVPVLRMGNIQRGKLDVSDLKYAELSKSDVEKFRLNEGDILFNRTNSLEQVGKSAVFTGLDGIWTAASYLIRLVADPTKADPRYINAYINSRRGRLYIEGTANKAIGMVNVNAKKARALPIFLPAVDVQKRIADALDKAATVADHLRHQQREQAAHEAKLTQSILARAFAGDL